MTHYTGADLAMADRHVSEGEQRITRQEEIINELRRNGHPTTAAEQLLTVFNETLCQHRIHRHAIAAALLDG